VQKTRFSLQAVMKGSTRQRATNGFGAVIIARVVDDIDSSTRRTPREGGVLRRLKSDAGERLQAGHGREPIDRRRPEPMLLNPNCSKLAK
jgi:hypothetical protein